MKPFSRVAIAFLGSLLSLPLFVGAKLAATVFGGNIWTSTDSGATWTEDTSVGSTKEWIGITSSSDGTKLAATVFEGNIWTSTDSGATWTEDTSVGSTKDWHLITSSSDGTKLAATVFGGNIWTFEAPSPCTCCQENMIKMGLNIGGECTVQT